MNYKIKITVNKFEPSEPFLKETKQRMVDSLKVSEECFKKMMELEALPDVAVALAALCYLLGKTDREGRLDYLIDSGDNIFQEGLRKGIYAVEVSQ